MRTLSLDIDRVRMLKGFLLLLGVLVSGEPHPSCPSTEETVIHCNCAGAGTREGNSSQLDAILVLLKEVKETLSETKARLRNVEDYIGQIPTKTSGGKGWCQGVSCLNGGKCVGLNECQCPSPYSGKRCERFLLGTKQNPALNARAILEAGDSRGSGMYWIQPSGETSPAMTYCDMDFRGGGWMLATYGYVAKATTDPNNKAIPNMNHPLGYTWLPNSRSSSSGVISLQHGAVFLARGASTMIMAAGHNPDTGGVNQYSYVYMTDISNNPYSITFGNHNRYHGATGGGGISLMHITEFNVTALRGETGSYRRYALGEALGVTWTDSYPSGYGFSDKKVNFATFDKGPFFPSVHSGDGRGATGNGAVVSYSPDVTHGRPNYVHKGWYTLTGTGMTGQTSIWFK